MTTGSTCRGYAYCLKPLGKLQDKHLLDALTAIHICTCPQRWRDLHQLHKSFIAAQHDGPVRTSQNTFSMAWQGRRNTRSTATRSKTVCAPPVRPPLPSERSLPPIWVWHQLCCSAISYTKYTFSRKWLLHYLYFDWQLPGSFSVRMGHLTWMSNVIYVQQNSMTSEIKKTSVVVVFLWILVVSGFNCLGSVELLPYSWSIFCQFRADSVDSDFFFLNQMMKSFCFLSFVTQRHPTHLRSSFTSLSCSW